MSERCAQRVRCDVKGNERQAVGLVGISDFGRYAGIQDSKDKTKGLVGCGLSSGLEVSRNVAPCQDIVVSHTADPLVIPFSSFTTQPNAATSRHGHDILYENP